MDISNPRKIKKNRLLVTIFTQHFKIVGEVHIQPGIRLTDFINGEPDQSFVAVTNAEIFNISGGQPVYTMDFLVINRNHITIAFPLTDSA
jgi:hypothetical protein